MSGWQEFCLRVFWYGGSTFDAWLNIASAKIATRILTIPESIAQMGLPSAIVFVLAQCVIGLWTQCLFNALYLKYMKMRTPLTPVGKRVSKNSPNFCQHNREHPEHQVKHVIQLHEVIGGLLGQRWKLVSLVLHVSTVFYGSFVQFLGCSNVIYFLNDSLNKRMWVCVFSAIFSLSILIPTAHNYRVWSFIGVITTIYVSIYLAGASIINGKLADVKYSSPHSYTEYFNGLSGLIIVGYIPIPIEVMDAMYKPQEYKVAYAYSVLYIFLVVMVPGLPMYIVYGDELLTSTNVLTKFTSSAYRSAAIVLLVIHAFITFGMYSLALYALWEKLLGVHRSPSYVKRTVSRVPVFLGLFLTALAFPFFGVVNRLLDSALTTWSAYILPCVAYNVVMWRGYQEESLSRLGLVVDFSVNFGIILWMVIVEFGLGTWGNIGVLHKIESFKLFEKCYNCNKL